MNPAELSNALQNGKTVMIAANCNISYSGRAESFLPDGDRIIMIKADKTLLVHQPHGSTPVNYMKEGTRYDITTEANRTLLSCRNEKEYMNIALNRIHFFRAHELSDGQKLQITGSEREMSQMIYNDPDLIEKGFRPLSTEEHTKFGFIDVFGYDQNRTLVVVECKRYAADPKAVDQLKRYADKVKHDKGLSRIRGIIAAPRLTPSAEEMLQKLGYEFRRISPPKYLEKFDSKQRRLEL
ncbi:endonuclease NucS [Candidatus Woesearchaeota archaeon]|nr:endonuclease NucS [Candidatus Woesearchaeota archaeon]